MRSLPSSIAVAMAGGLVVLPVAPAAAQPIMIDPAIVAGCYEVRDNLPWHYTVSFCLTLEYNGHMHITGPGVLCDRGIGWTSMRTGLTPLEVTPGAVHINVKYLSISCRPASEVLADDIYCLPLTSGDLDCVFDQERHLEARRVLANRVL